MAMHQPYDDSILTLTSAGAPDPFINSFCGRYYFVSGASGPVFDRHLLTTRLDVHRREQS